MDGALDHNKAQTGDNLHDFVAIRTGETAFLFLRHFIRMLRPLAVTWTWGDERPRVETISVHPEPLKILTPRWTRRRADARPHRLFA
jgi:hypothetical protein